MPAAEKVTANARLPIDAPERRRLPQLLRRAWYGLNQAFRRQLAPLGVTPDQFTVLRTLLENADITQRQLANLMTSDPNTIASLVDRMERQGLVARKTRDKDRRANLLRLKPLGRQKYEAARQVAIRLQTDILSALPENSREIFLAQLDAVADASRNAAKMAPKAQRGAGKPRSR